ncbi:hypothetical protein NUACC21_64070 [Scytonema sp. NUACC21]
MAEYTVVVIIMNSGNKEISYSLDLTGTYEDYPEDYFQVTEHRAHLRNTLETKTARQVSDTQLHQVINTWMEDIKQGLHRSTIRLELTSKEIFVENSKPQGEEPNIIRSKVVPPQPKQPKKDLPNPTIEQRSTKNQRDF